MFDPPPKPKRRMILRLLIPALLIGGLVVAAVVAEAGEETKAELEYLDLMRDQASELARSGASVSDLFGRLREVSRDEFTTVMDGVQSDLDTAIVFITPDPPTESLIPVWSLYRQAIEAWSRGITALEASILVSADNPNDATVVNEVADALAELRAGDALFLDLKVEFEREEVPDPVSPLVVVRLSPADGGLATLAVGYINAARSSTNNLGLRPGLSLAQITTDPEWQVNVTGQAVVPFTETMVFSVVVTNDGNVASGVEALELTLTDGTEQITRTNAEIPPLAPNGQTAVEFPPLAVDAETLYQVDVKLVVVNPDSDLTDNELSVQFTVNPS